MMRNRDMLYFSAVAIFSSAMEKNHVTILLSKELLTMSRYFPYIDYII